MGLNLKIFERKNFYFHYSIFTCDTGAGVLVTHCAQFRGCEADLVIIVCQYWGMVQVGGQRSSVTRARANMGLIISDFDINVDNIKKYYKIIDSPM